MLRSVACCSSLYVCGLALCGLAGCSTARSTDTARTGMEQLLISNSVDHALNLIDFRPLAHRAVFVEDKYMDGVDKNYVVGSLRHRVLQAGARLASKREDADVVLEVRSGGLGTDKVDTFIGVPEFSLPGPYPLSLPEVRVMSRTKQSGTAKLGLVAYDAKTGRVLGDGGVTLAQADDSNWFVMGMGPFQSGTVRRELAEKAGASPLPLDLPPIGLASQAERGERDQDFFRPASSEEEAAYDLRESPPPREPRPFPGSGHADY